MLRDKVGNKQRERERDLVSRALLLEIDCDSVGI